MPLLPFFALLMTWVMAGPGLRAVLRDGDGKDIGTVEVEPAPGSVHIIARLHDAPPGERGLHVHAGTSCGAPPFADAGPHFDPKEARHHSGPLGNGHAGDLGNIVIDDKGRGKLDLFTRRLSLGPDSTGIAGRTIILHANRDNLTNDPENGGSGARIACGVLQVQ